MSKYSISIETSSGGLDEDTFIPAWQGTDAGGMYQFSQFVKIENFNEDKIQLTESPSVYSLRQEGDAVMLSRNGIAVARVEGSGVDFAKFDADLKQSDPEKRTVFTFK